MIKKIELVNFQPHHKTIIELHDCVNVIQGLSDSGKSALLRGIDAVLRRAPFYLTYNKDSGKSEITFDNGDVISRNFTKTKINKCPACKSKVSSDSQVCESCGEFLSVKSSEEFYMINDERRDRFGKTLPEFITDFTRITPFEIFDTEIFLNFAKQHEPMFFVSDKYTGSLRNKMISMLLPDSDKVDVLIKELNSEKLNASANIKVYSKQQTATEEILNMIAADFADAETAFNSLSELELDIRQAEHKLDAMVAMLAQLKRISPLLKLTPTIDTINKKISTAERLIETTQDNEIAIKTLKSLDLSLQSLNNYDNIDLMEFVLFESIDDEIVNLKAQTDKLTLLELYKTKLTDIKTVELPDVPTMDFPEVEEFKLSQLECLKYNHETLNKRISENEIELHKIKNEIDLLKLEFDNDKTICPITNKPFCVDCIEAIKNEFV